MKDIELEQHMTVLAAHDCHCESCAKTSCVVRQKLQRLPVSMGGLGECQTYGGGYVQSDKAEAVSALYYRYRGMVQERKGAKRANRYQAYSLASLLSAITDPAANLNAENNLWTIAGLLDYNPEQLREDIIALKQAAEDAL